MRYIFFRVTKWCMLNCGYLDIVWAVWAKKLSEQLFIFILVISLKLILAGHWITAIVQAWVISVVIGCFFNTATRPGRGGSWGPRPCRRRWRGSKASWCSRTRARGWTSSIWSLHSYDLLLIPVRLYCCTICNGNQRVIITYYRCNHRFVHLQYV